MSHTVWVFFSFLYVWLNLIEAHRLWWFWPFTVYSLFYSLHLNCNPRLLIASHTAVLQLLLIKVKPTSTRSNRDGKGWREFLYLQIFSTSIMSCPKTSYKMRTKKNPVKNDILLLPFCKQQKTETLILSLISLRKKMSKTTYYLLLVTFKIFL